MREKANAREERMFDFRKMGAIIEKNFKVLIRDPTRLIPLMMFPIAMIVVLGFASGNTPKHIPAAIVIYDSSPLSQMIQQEIADSQFFTIRRVVSTEGEAKKLLDNEKVRVIIEIPPHLQENLQNGIPSAITVIVDESDSAISATSKGVMSGIVGKLSAKISAQKLTNAQSSMGEAAQKIAEYTATQGNKYGLIAARVDAAQKSLSASQSLIDQQRAGLLAALPSPIIVSPRILSSENSSAVSSQNTFIAQAPGAEASASQIAALSRSSEMLSAASQNAESAKKMAQSADQHELARSQDYEENVEKPLASVNAFARSKASGILTPLVYEEKPAYGTGRQPIDFLIPSLIALTLFQGALMGMGRSVAGEKRDGSLTRVFLTPTSNVTIIFGTLAFYICFELVRAAFLLAFSMVIFNVKIEGSILLITLILVIYIGISTAIGMMLSTLVKTEQQFMAMAMIVSMPTMFLSGAFFPLQSMPKSLQSVAIFLPATYASDALRGVMVKGFSLAFILAPLAVLLIFFSISLSGLLVLFKRNIE